MITIGLIDDHDLFRNSLRALLTASNLFSISIDASDGEEFLAKLKSESHIPDIIITDFQMPKLNGKHLIEGLKSKYPSIRIIVLSMFNHFHLISSLIQVGAYGFLSKGIKANQLIEAINCANRGKFVLSVGDSFQSLDTADLASVISSRVSLTSRQVDFLKLCAVPDLTYKEIADQLNISPKTADRYRDELFKKLDVSSRGGLLLYAIQCGLVNY